MMALPIRHVVRNQTPECFGVVLFYRVAQLMHDDVILYRWREFHNARVELDNVAGIAACPAALEYSRQ